MSTYDADIIAWANEQARLLRARCFDQLDIEHIADEIEDVARAEQRALAARMADLLAGLLRWQHQPGLRCSNWQGTIELQREAVRLHLRRTPSLRLMLADDDWRDEMWCGGVLAAIKETGLANLPKACPWTMEMVLADDFLPD